LLIGNLVPRFGGSGQGPRVGSMEPYACGVPLGRGRKVDGQSRNPGQIEGDVAGAASAIHAGVFCGLHQDRDRVLGGDPEKFRRRGSNSRSLQWLTTAARRRGL